MTTIALVLGTRPEIIKMSPVISLCQKRDLDFYIIHSNQHYSKNLDQIFFEQLKLPQPDYSLEVGSGTHGEQTGKMLQRIEKIFLVKPPSFVLVHGDTNTTLAGALSAAKLKIPIGHIEAGLRSNDRKMPEEINRIMTDHLSSICFAPTNNQREILRKEGIEEEKIIITGNTIVDAVKRNISLASDKILKRLDIQPQQYILTTIHREENVDIKSVLKDIIGALEEISDKYHLPVVAPFHPRTRKALDRENIHPDKLLIIEPTGYLEFLTLMKEAKLIITDSGGIQEEACILGTPCVTARNNTERPETITVGANVLGGINKASLHKTVNFMLTREKKTWQQPFGDGRSSYRILDDIYKRLS